MESHLLQMRGLKQKRCATSTRAQKSHLLQMRGLKLGQIHFDCTAQLVASFTDAWIETERAPSVLKALPSHLLQMRGLKQD